MRMLFSVLWHRLFCVLALVLLLLVAVVLVLVLVLVLVRVALAGNLLARIGGFF